jgi:hypothetical protein
MQEQQRASQGSHCLRVDGRQKPWSRRHGCWCNSTERLFSKAQTKNEQAKRLTTMALEFEKQGISPWKKDSVIVDGTRVTMLDSMRME